MVFGRASSSRVQPILLDDNADGKDHFKVNALAQKWQGRSGWVDRWETGEYIERPLGSLKDTGVLQVLCLCWNQHGKAYRGAVDQLLPAGLQHHLYVVATAECERSIPKSVLQPGKPKWERGLHDALGQDCALLASGALGAMHIAVYARNEIAGLVSDVQLHSLPTGWHGFLGNKGAVFVSLSVGATSFLFINTHLPSGKKKVKKRNHDAALILGAKGDLLDPSVQRAALDGFDRVFFMGDLNYRVDCSREEAEHKLALGDHDALLRRDQLKAEMAAPLWRDFVEGPVAFPPTYKYDQGTDTFDSSKKARVPAWTDRILYVDNPNISLVAYDSLKNVRDSDHRPVFAQFDVGVDVKPGAEGTPPTPCRSASRGACAVM